MDIYIEDIFVSYVFNSGLKSYLSSQRNTCSVKVLRYPVRHFALGEYRGRSPLVELPRLTWEYSKALPLPRNSPQVNAGYMDRCRTMCSAVSAILIGTGEMKPFGLCPDIIAPSPFHSEFRIQAGDPARVPLQCLRRMFIYDHNSMHIEQNSLRNLRQLLIIHPSKS
jgi:hypothetical protein